MPVQHYLLKRAHLRTASINGPHNGLHQVRTLSDFMTVLVSFDGYGALNPARTSSVSWHCVNPSKRPLNAFWFLASMLILESRYGSYPQCLPCLRSCMQITDNKSSKFYLCRASLPPQSFFARTPDILGRKQIRRRDSKSLPDNAAKRRSNFLKAASNITAAVIITSRKLSRQFP